MVEILILLGGIFSFLLASQGIEKVWYFLHLNEVHWFWFFWAITFIGVLGSWMAHRE